MSLSLFRLDASIRTEGSHSRQIADIVEREWHGAHPDSTVTNREIGLAPLPSTAWAAAVAANATAEEARSPEQLQAVALPGELTDELQAADAFLFAVPLYNFGVSQHFKTYVDLVITDPRMAAGSDPVIAGKPGVPATVHGGYYAAGTPREGWDHATGWMRRILADVWKVDLLVVEKDFTLVGVAPALDQFQELAAQLAAEAEATAKAQRRKPRSQKRSQRPRVEGGLGQPFGAGRSLRSRRGGPSERRSPESHEARSSSWPGKCRCRNGWRV